MTTDVTGFIAQPVRAGQVGTVADEHDTGLQRRWPDALQQRPHLLDPAARLAQQLFATRAQMPRRRSILAAAPMTSASAEHTRTACPFIGQLPENPPAITGRLAGHGHAGEAGAEACAAAQSNAAPRSHARYRSHVFSNRYLPY